MSGPINIGSPAEWQSLLSGTNVVVADFYADWCGPCKAIAPHYERLATQYSRPKKVAFAKINTDTQSSVSGPLGVRAMPTFMIFHKGNCIETIKGANPSALTEAVAKAVKLSDGGGGGGTFKTPGRTLGGSSKPASRGSWDLGRLLAALIALVGLYLVSLLSFDPYKAAEQSRFNINGQQAPRGSGPAPSGANGARPPQKATFRTLADLGSE